MEIKQTASIGFLLAFAIFALPSLSRACSCESLKPLLDPQTLAGSQQLNGAIVFSGTVKSIRKTSLVTLDWQNPGSPFIKTPNEVKFAAKEFWQGAVSPEVTIYAYSETASCGIDFKVGESYLIWIPNNYPLEASMCSRTKLLSRAENELKILGAGRNPNDFRDGA